MKRMYAAVLALCFLLCCVLTGCSGSIYDEGDWEEVYSSLDSDVYEDDLEYKISVYTRTGALMFFDVMQYRIDIYESSDLSEPHFVYYSDWLDGVYGVDMKHTMVKDPGMEPLYEKYVNLLGVENSITLLTDLQAEIKKDGADEAVNDRIKTMAETAFNTLRDSCSTYAGTMAEDVYKASLNALAGSVLDSTTQSIDGIKESIFGQHDDLNLFTTKTMDFLDDLGVYVDEEDIDLTLGISDATKKILNSLVEVNYVALLSDDNLANATIDPLYTACKDRRNELITFVLESGET